MDFDLSEEQRLLQETVRRFLAERCPPERVRAAIESADGRDRELEAAAAELGIAALLVPAEHGGVGSELLDAALVSLELGRACAPGPFLAGAMATVALVSGDDDAAKARWLPKLAAGEAVATVALGETGAEWRPERLRTSVNAGRVTGEKPLVLYGAESDALVVAAVERDVRS